MPNFPTNNDESKAIKLLSNIDNVILYQVPTQAINRNAKHILIVTEYLAENEIKIESIPDMQDMLNKAHRAFSDNWYADEAFIGRI